MADSKNMGFRTGNMSITRRELLVGSPGLAAGASVSVPFSAAEISFRPPTETVASSDLEC